MPHRTIYWFRKALRLHDNPSLMAALKSSPDALYPVFILDPKYARTMRVGGNRWNFLYVIPWLDLNLIVNFDRLEPGAND